MNRKRAQAALAQAALHLEQGNALQAHAVAQQVIGADVWRDETPYAIAGEALHQLGRLGDAVAMFQAGLQSHVAAPQLLARLGAVRLEMGEVDEALRLFERAKAGLKREPTFLTHYASALLEAGLTERAEAELAAALLLGGGPDTRLVMAMAKGRRGLYADAEALAKQVERSGPPALKAKALAVRADARLLQGDPADALLLWQQLETNGQLEPSSLAHMAYAAQAVGDAAKAQALVRRRLEQGATADDQLLFAQVANLRQDAAAALDHLVAAEASAGRAHPGWSFELASTKGRTLRLLGRKEEAAAELSRASQMPEAQHGALGARVLVDQGHLAAEAGDFERAAAHFEEALRRDPGEPEAARALRLTSQRLAWRAAITADAEARVEAARALASAEARRLQGREVELSALRREVERLKAHAASAEARAAQADADAKSQAAEQKADEERRLQAELNRRETHADETSDVLLTQWLGAAKEYCPPALWQVLLVAERTYQRAVFTELPAAAVAVLYSGALERALVTCFVADFDAWLESNQARAALLAAATRERRAGRPEYFDRFVESFDPSFRGRPPSLGEVARAVEKCDEPYLAPFGRFLRSRGFQPSFLTALATFIEWAKKAIRDPAAHGHADAVDFDALKRFRESLLVRFESGPGLVPALLAARGRA
jgi:hypothetical protein